jgi:hypothetical protein
MTEPSPTQVALRELVMLTKCYCDGEHPRLGHNCSFRPDVMTLVTNIGAVLEICNEAIAANDPRFPADAADDIRRALLGLPADEGPPWNTDEPVAHSALIAQRLQQAAQRHAAEPVQQTEEGATPVSPG